MEETNNIPSENGTDRKVSAKMILAYVAVAFFCAFIVYYAVMALLGPARKIEAINAEFAYKVPENSTVDERLFTDSSFVRLNREKAYYQARITMAETDSISLSLNMSDSTATLEINGVAIHIAKISWMKLSRVFSKADEYAITSMLSSPFTVKRDYSSIKKEPVMLKIAPKDTSEYKPDILPDTSNTEAVNYILEMENGFRLYVYQADDEEKGDLNRFLFDFADRVRNTLYICRSIIAFKVPEYHPAIKIRLPKADARSIYRGLPRQGQIALFR